MPEVPVSAAEEADEKGKESEGANHKYLLFIYNSDPKLERKLNNEKH
jgi:hypothetical protein